MKRFNAKDAIELTKKVDPLELEKVINKIKTEASKGNTALILYYKLSESATTDLTNRGFKIYREYDSREQGYFTRISWALSKP